MTETARFDVQGRGRVSSLLGTGGPEKNGLRRIHMVKHHIRDLYHIVGRKKRPPYAEGTTLSRRRT